jgi:hypothetical protein
VHILLYLGTKFGARRLINGRIYAQGVLGSSLVSCTPCVPFYPSWRERSAKWAVYVQKFLLGLNKSAKESELARISGRTMTKSNINVETQ